MYIWFHVEYTLFPSDCNGTWIFLDRFWGGKKLKYQISRKIRPVGAELFHEEGETVRNYEADGRLLQFCERRQKPALRTLDKGTGISAHEAIKVYPLQVNHVTTGNTSYCRVSPDRLLVCCCTLESPWYDRVGLYFGHQPVHVWSTSSVWGYIQWSHQGLPLHCDASLIEDITNQL